MTPTGSVSGRSFTSFRELADFFWQNAERLRGAYKPHEYDKVILPFLVLRRLDCVLAPTKAKVLAKHAALVTDGTRPDDGKYIKILGTLSKVRIFNTSRLDFAVMRGAPSHLGQDLKKYLRSFSPDAREILEHLKVEEQIARLDAADLLFQVVDLFAGVNLHPDAVDNHTMGMAFEELIRRFNEKKNEEAGDHYTPRDIIELMVDLLFCEDDATLSKPGIVKSLYDPACGTGGMLSVAEDYLRRLNPGARLEVFGQELNAETYAISKCDMILKGQDARNIVHGNSFSQDGHPGQLFDYQLSNPPFGVDWKNVQKFVEDEHAVQGHAGRFGPGLPRINDGALLFLLHMIAKMKRGEGKADTPASRLAIVLNGSPLFTGDAGSGESEIRRHVLENDMVEAIVALPEQLFYNTGIATYIWVLTTRKDKRRASKVQLIDATGLYQKMRKSLGNKRHELSEAHRATIVKTFGDMKKSEISRVFANEDFGYRRICVERPLRLSFQVTPERLERLKEESGFANLAKSKKKGAAGEREVEEGREQQTAILKALDSVTRVTIFKSRPAFEAALDAALTKAELRLPALVRKAVLAALSERDDTADICLDSEGHPEPDSELRDSENVPLEEKVADYFAREVLPHVPDAWIDETKERIGYEIPITRHFYKYKELRPLEEIEKEIRELEGEIAAALQGLGS